jgi:phytoene synthase
MSKRTVEPSIPISAEAVLARSGRTFHLASRLLPLRMRREAAELYAFCRRMDDLADEETVATLEARHKQLGQMLEVLRADPLSDAAEALGWPVELEMRFAGISKIAAILTESLAADTGARRIADEPALLEYAFGVAGTVGLMMCRILGAPPAGAEAATHLGIAMQLTNIARDVREDLHRDRIYLPAAWVSPAEVKAAIQLATGAAPVQLHTPAADALRDAIHRLLALAEEFYRSADRGMHYLPWRARISILAAAACYREIGVRVGKDTALSWKDRAVVPATVKANLVFRACIRSFRTATHRSSVAVAAPTLAVSRSAEAGSAAKVAVER